MSIRPASDSSLRRRLLSGLIVYLALLSTAIVLHGLRINEDAERLVWQSLLEAELDQLQAGRHDAPGIRDPGIPGMALYDSRGASPVPRELQALPPGLHDDVHVGGRERVVLVRAAGDAKQILSLDITEFENREFVISLSVAGSAFAAMVLLSLVAAWGVNRLVRPLDHLASQIAALVPERPGQRIVLPTAATDELTAIGNAVNGYLARNDQFLRRERAFIDTTSHELRTPLAVISGAVDLALQPADVPDVTQAQLQRIRRTTDELAQLVSLLLVLAKDPARLGRTSDRIALDALLLDIVDDHRHLTRDKDLVLAIGPVAPAVVVAPLPIVQAAIGNLLRNAIENSDRGEIRVRLDEGGTVVIEDPGHGMSPEEISRVYSRLARGSRDAGAGIGLELIARLCEHLGWRLDLSSQVDRGTRTMLSFGPAAGTGRIE